MGIVQCCMIFVFVGCGEVWCRYCAVMRCYGDECCSGYVLSGDGIVSLSIVGVVCCHVEVL